MAAISYAACGATAGAKRLLNAAGTLASLFAIKNVRTCTVDLQNILLKSNRRKLCQPQTYIAIIPDHG